ncbi:hypothetical protein [Agrobacterium sp. ST15.13.015]|uniref:hypothetical protein n=1 Tax=Agrobacterium sp. ST15.13.015 TaxID=3017319 RepID=UPI0022BC0C99|nr:hypothetical protein [Agrobacterium sp. ST15.13.015]MCZ7501258.1 hypothetical protein [Rhizobium rhizogenes]
MLAAEAVRLVAIELLRPSDIPEGGNFPTLAGSRVFDSRGPTLTEIDHERRYTPVLSVYTQKSSADAAGAASGFDDTEATVSLLVMAELAVITREGSTDYVDAMTAGTDVEARLVLAALVAQVRRRLEFSAAGAPWRKLVKQVLRVDEETHAVPEFGLRWQRIFCTYNLAIGDDDFDMSRPGLPEPLGSVAAALPDGSYAKQKLAELAACFAAENPDQLTTIHGVTAGPGGTSLETGQDDLIP